MKKTMHGFSLMELMVTVAILAIISAIAIPSYNGYVKTAALGAAAATAVPLQQSLENYYLERDTYGLSGDTFPKTYSYPTGSNNAIPSVWGWDVTTDGDSNLTYEVVLSSATAYTLTIKHPDYSSDDYVVSKSH